MTGLVLARDDEGVRSTTTIAKGGEERERSWQSKQGRTRVHDGVDRLHYVRDRAKLLGI